eukprot:1180856-Prorocentrum_minimum.AAC.6
MEWANPYDFSHVRYVTSAAKAGYQTLFQVKRFSRCVLPLWSHRLAGALFPHWQTVKKSNTAFRAALHGVPPSSCCASQSGARIRDEQRDMEGTEPKRHGAHYFERALCDLPQGEGMNRASALYTKPHA